MKVDISWVLRPFSRLFSFVFSLMFSHSAVNTPFPLYTHLPSCSSTEKLLWIIDRESEAINAVCLGNAPTHFRECLSASRAVLLFIDVLVFSLLVWDGPSWASCLRLHLRGTRHKLLSARGSAHSLCMTDKSKSEDLTVGVWLHN